MDVESFIKKFFNMLIRLFCCGSGILTLFIGTLMELSIIYESIPASKSVDSEVGVGFGYGAAILLPFCIFILIFIIAVIWKKAIKSSLEKVYFLEKSLQNIFEKLSAFVIIGYFVMFLFMIVTDLIYPLSSPIVSPS